MVGVAQLVESRIVIPVVVGSSPIVHPILESESVAGLFAQLTGGTEALQTLCFRVLFPDHPSKMFYAKRLIVASFAGKTCIFLLISTSYCESGGIGRRAGFRYQCL